MEQAPSSAPSIDWCYSGRSRPWTIGCSSTGAPSWSGSAPRGRATRRRRWPAPRRPPPRAPPPRRRTWPTASSSSPRAPPVDSRPPPPPATVPQMLGRDASLLRPALAGAATKTERYTSRSTRRRPPHDGRVGAASRVECKTCNKCFPTFQALGSHRASHKKPRLAGADDNSPANATTVANAKLSKPPAMKTASPSLTQMTTASPPPPPPPQVDVAPDVTTVLSLNNGDNAVCNAINTR
ncbi:hypothetical protein ZWY2020_017525 [Hordeum vulgare]|nr:hypothetical protein ZWY2020_017525 [Hordeum vulgare]